MEERTASSKPSLVVGFFVALAAVGLPVVPVGDSVVGHSGIPQSAGVGSDVGTGCGDDVVGFVVIAGDNAVGLAVVAAGFPPDGPLEGASVAGSEEGEPVGLASETSVGIVVKANGAEVAGLAVVGLRVVGLRVVGLAVGGPVGGPVGSPVGSPVGILVGLDVVGLALGGLLGIFVGLAVVGLAVVGLAVVGSWVGYFVASSPTPQLVPEYVTSR
mmetsp:Transcript_36358/g.81748  ORF Transcript_36358/g.81748 Transcript_36358/m.81748 type:complete len:215 (+) Transcript_36358:794-1438(+)